MLIFQDLQDPSLPASGDVDRMSQCAIVAGSSECRLAFGQAPVDLSDETDWGFAYRSKKSQRQVSGQLNSLEGVKMHRRNWRHSHTVELAIRIYNRKRDPTRNIILGLQGKFHIPVRDCMIRGYSKFGLT